MSVIDEALTANDYYAGHFKLGHLPMPPSRKLAVLACMDARLTVEQILGLNTGDAHVVRNAGGILTEDALRSLIISHYLLGTQEFLFLHHTDCGMLTFKDDELAARLRETTGTAAIEPSRFYAFSDLAEDVRQQVEKARAHPWVPKAVAVRGFIYDVRTGKLSEVRELTATA
jgi:carbonic anhydrase